MNNDLKNARILIIDDQDSNILVLEELLLMKGYFNIHKVNDAREALAAMANIKPHLVLLDLMMPHLSGYDILDLMRAEGYMDGFMPVLVLTADATSEAKKMALEKGASDFLTKPFNLSEVNARITNLLRNVCLLLMLSNQNTSLEQKVDERTKEIQQHMRRIQEQNDALRKIAWSQSHQVRAPLVRIMGLISILENGYDVSGVKKSDVVAMIKNSAKELDAIIHEITKQITPP